MYTTLNKILAEKPPDNCWNMLLLSLGKTYPDDEPLAFTRILDAIGLIRAIWCLRTIDAKKEKQQYMEFCSKGATHEEMINEFIRCFGDK
jgi:hypothetical protein